MYFASDNSGPMHPAVAQAMIAADTGYQPSYGTDPIMDGVREQIREIFEAPEAAVYLVATGTAANALALATLAQPWEAVFCTPLAHINVDECHAPEFYTGGAKLSLVGAGDKMTAEQLRARIESWAKGDVHTSQRGPVQVTQVTEMGRLYTLDELHALTSVAREYGLPTFLDGARVAKDEAAQMARYGIRTDAMLSGAVRDEAPGLSADVAGGSNSTVAPVAKSG